MWWVLLFLVGCEATCYANDQGIGPYVTDCSFPFSYEGKLHSECIVSSFAPEHQWCPTATNSTRHPLPDKWGFCKCENICPEHREIEATSGVIATTTPDHFSYPALNCTWHVVNPDHATMRVPTTIFFATGYQVNQAEVYVRDTNDRNEIMAIRSHQNFAYTTDSEFWVHMTTPRGGSFAETFQGRFYSGFCSDVDGTMELPAYDFHFSEDPFIPMISDKYLISNGTRGSNFTESYRPHSYCNWIIPALVPTSYDNSRNRLRTLNFFSFDLGAGDVIDVFVWNNLQSFEKIHSFTASNPPVPVSSYAKMKISFRSDGRDEGTGFAASIYRETCSPHTVLIQAPYGTLTDGSTKTAEYLGGVTCSWLISRAPEETITFSFNSFRLYEGDSLTLFEGTGIEGKTLGVFTGEQSTTGIVITARQNLFLLFSTNDREKTWGSWYGFEATWKVCDAKCLACQPGTYYDFDASICRACPPSQVSLRHGSTSCTSCPNGTMWISPAKCDSCLPGSFSDNGKECKDCELGTVALKEGATICEKCTNGTYASINGTACLPCGAGLEANETGTGCRPIPVPEKPTNNTVVLIYCGVGVGVLLIIGAVIGFFQWKKSQSDYTYQALPTFS